MPIAEWTQLARKDLQSIYRYIAEQDHRPEGAEKVVRGMRVHCDQYATHFSAGHTLGTARPELGEEVRVVSFQRWVIVFRPHGDGIQVLRIFDGKRDYAKLFKQNPGG